MLRELVILTGAVVCALGFLEYVHQEFGSQAAMASVPVLCIVAPLAMWSLMIRRA